MYNATTQGVEWTIKKLYGGTETQLVTVITLTSPTALASKREVGPISLQFEICSLALSNFALKSVKPVDSSKEPPFRWVRYVTRAGSYVCRL